MELSPEVLRLVVAKMVILILSICVHEFGHAFVADKLGDRLPRQQGRVTLNPFAHADPIGTLAMPAFFLLTSGGASTGFGWGRPVLTQPWTFTRRFSQRTGSMFVSAAGPGMNIFFGLFLALVLFALIKGGVVSHAATWDPNHLAYMVRYAILINFVLAFFNLIPAPPLDGGSVVRGLLPARHQHHYEAYAKYGMFVAAAFMFIPTLAIVFIWPAQQLMYLVTHVILGI